jgi:hypothetical protein
MTAKRFLSKIEVVQLRKQGFTVSDSSAVAGTTITGVTDNQLKEHIRGGKARLQQLKRLRFR